MKVTVGIITRDRENFLIGCLDALCKQISLPSRVIIVENNQAWHHSKLVNNFTSKLNIRYLLEKRIGIPYARNTVIEHATGDLLLFLDDDCKPGPNWTQKHIIAHNQNKKCIAIQGGVSSQHTNHAVSLVRQFLRYIRQKRNIYKISGGVYTRALDTCNVSFKLDQFKRLNFRFDTSLKRASDCDLGWQLISCDKLILYKPEIKVDHLERDNILNLLKQWFWIGFWKFTLFVKWRKQKAKEPFLTTSFFAIYPLVKYFASHKKHRLVIQGILIYTLLRLSFIAGHLFYILNSALSRLVIKTSYKNKSSSRSENNE